MNERFEATESERQLIEIIREQEEGSVGFRLLIERVDGAWEIVMSISPHDERNKSRGVGNSFDQGWANMSPLWA